MEQMKASKRNCKIQTEESIPLPKPFFDVNYSDNMESEDEEDLNGTEDHERNVAARELKERLRSLRTCYNMMKQHGNSLEHTITTFQTHPEMKNNEDQFEDYLTMLSDRAILFAISSRAMLKTCSKFMESADLDGHRVFKMLEIEREHSRELERMLYDVAKQHTTLERKSRGVARTASVASKTQSFYETDDEDEDNAAVNETERETEAEHEPAEVTESQSLHAIRYGIWKSRYSRKLTQHQIESASVPETPVLSPRKSTRKRRERVPDRPNVSINAWSLLKNSIGKDLSKIPMPVNFNEPLSFLQRLTEEMEYAELLDTAAGIADKYEQIAYVAAFIISTYATTASRTAKPFNPLLNETYECDRTDDRGWRSIAEQVSHHPPISAMYCEANEWTCWKELTVKMKFKGKNLQIVPTGNIFCKFTKTGNTYTWNKVVTTVNNIIVGKMWLDQQGEVEIAEVNTPNGAYCRLVFIPYSMFSRERQRRVKGVVRDAAGVGKFAVEGYWDSHAAIAPIGPDTTNDEPNKESFQTIWNRLLPEPESEKYHSFSKFACELNEMEEDVAPTDSRRRPDLRLMEQGLWDESNVEKLRVEQKQRNRRPVQSEHDTTRASQEHIDPHLPLWFTRTMENGKIVHKYNFRYWEAKKDQDWSMCPDIF